MVLPLNRMVPAPVRSPYIYHRASAYSSSFFGTRSRSSCTIEPAGRKFAGTTDKCIVLLPLNWMVPAPIRSPYIYRRVSVYSRSIFGTRSRSSCTIEPVAQTFTGTTDECIVLLHSKHSFFVCGPSIQSNRHCLHKP